jgi:hypothetical protein
LTANPVVIFGAAAAKRKAEIHREPRAKDAMYRTFHAPFADFADESEPV